MIDLKAAKEVHRLVYEVTTRNIPNFGGNHGFNLSPASNPDELLRASSNFLGLVNSGNNPSYEQIEALRAECMLGMATGLLGSKDIEKINKLLDMEEK